MKTLAIIAEYNPLHSGHEYHWQESIARSGATHSLILMSGNFVQRGEPAITDKFTRARQAIEMGADLVLELPFLYAVNSAQYFAEGALNILHHSGVVDVLSFGSESADLDQLQASAKRLLEPEHGEEIKQLMQSGLSYAKAVETRLGHFDKSPNDILAIQYLRALQRLNSSIEPLVIPRQGSYHDEALTVRYPSATAIRQAHKQGKRSDITHPIFFEDLRKMIYSRLILDDLSSTHGMKEGIWHALQHAALRTHTLNDLLDACRTPRFSLARLRRLLIQSLMGYTQAHQAELQGVYYYRPLAFNTKGRELLKAIKHNQPERFVPTLARYSGDATIEAALAFDIKSSNLYYHLQQTGPEQARKAIYMK